MSNSGDLFVRHLVSHDRELRRYISTFVPRRDDVEEILQQTAAILWEKFDQYDQQRDFLPWARRFAYFEVLNYRKHQARSRMVYSEDVIRALANTQDQLSDELQGRRSALRDCLADLEPKDQELIAHRYGGSSTLNALSSKTGRTAKALYRRLDRVRELVAECVDRRLAVSDQ